MSFGTTTCGGCMLSSTGPAPLCRVHGCRVCGSVILADCEDWPQPLCFACAPMSFLTAAEAVFRAAQVYLLDGHDTYRNRDILVTALKELGR